MIEIGKGGQGAVQTVMMSRYALHANFRQSSCTHRPIN